MDGALRSAGVLAQVKHSRKLALASLAVGALAATVVAQPPTALYVVRRDGAYGFADAYGKVVIKAQFEGARHFAENRAPVQLKGSWGYIDTTGKLVIKPQYVDAEPFSEGLAPVQLPNNPRRGFIEASGVMKIPAQFERTKRFSEGLAPVRVDGRWGFVDRDGKLVIAAKYDLAEPLSSGLAPVKTASKWGFIDRNGKVVIQPTFDDAWGFVEGRAPVRFADAAKAKSVLIDKSGKAVAEPGFDVIGAFSEGLAPVRKGQAWGYMDLNGKEVIKTEFAAAAVFVNGLAEVSDPVFAHVVYVDRSGNRRFVKSEKPEPGFGAEGLVPVELSSKPRGATVYMVPLYEWEADPAHRNLKYHQVTEGRTDVTTHVFPRVYIVLFEFGGKRDYVRLDVLKGKPNRAFIAFP